MAQQDADSNRRVTLDEVVVQSEGPKRLSPLFMQPVSSTTVSSAEMERYNIQSMSQVADYVSGFAMPAYGSRYTSSMYMRGVGSRLNNPSVALYVDNIPMVSKSMLNFHLYEIDRVEVLRGPQGTLYGQNSEGGLVSIYSRRPMDREGTDVDLSFGSALQRKAEVAHYSRLGSRLGLSLAGFYQGAEGFFENSTTGSPADRMDEAGGRLRLQWQPSERLRIDATADYQYTDQNAFAYGEMSDGVTLAPYANRQNSYRRHMLVAGLSVGYAAGHMLLGSTTSWQLLNDDMQMDVDYRPQDYMHMEQHQRQRALTQELVARSKGDGPWRWTLGAFYAYQASRIDAPVFFDSAMNNYLSQTIEDLAYYGMLNAMARGMGREAAAALIESRGGCHIRMDMAMVPGLFETPSHNAALFHQSEVDITSRLTASLGLRYDYSHVVVDYRTKGAVALDESVMGVDVDATVSSELAHRESVGFGQLLPKVGLTYRVDTIGSNLYAVVSKGYRAGGFNIQMFSDILQSELQDAARSARADVEIAHTEQDYDNIRKTIEFAPEECWNYELGTHLALDGARLMADISVYYMQVRNQQLSVLAGDYGFGRMMVNAGRSSSCGVEVMVRGRAFGNRLDWGLGYGYTHAAFEEYADSVDSGNGLSAVDYSGKRVPFVPDHMLSAYADWHINFAGSTAWRLAVGGNLSLCGRTFWDVDNQFFQSAYCLIGAHVDAELGRVRVGLWVRNLTNADYNTFVTESRMAGETLYFAQRGNPVQLGVRMRVRL